MSLRPREPAVPAVAKTTTIPSMTAMTSRLDEVLRVGHANTLSKAVAARTAPTAMMAPDPNPDSYRGPDPESDPETKRQKLSPDALPGLSVDALAQIAKEARDLSCGAILQYLQDKGIDYQSADLEPLWKTLCVQKNWKTNPFDNAGTVPYMGTWRAHFDEWCRVIKELSDYKFNLETAPDSYKSDFVLMSEAVKRDVVRLEHVSEELRNNRKFILEVVAMDGYALRFVPEAFQNDADVVLKAVKNNGWSIAYASESLRGNRKIGLAAVKKHYEAFKELSEELRKDREIVREAIRSVKDKDMLTSVLDEVLLDFGADENRDIVEAAVKKNGRVLWLKYMPEKFLNDKEIVMMAIKNEKEMFYLASAELQADEEVRKATKFPQRQLTPGYIAEQSRWLKAHLRV